MSPRERNLFAVLSVLIGGYLILRAVWVPVSHDEVASYFTYMQSANFIPPWSYMDAANHILNSALGAFFSSFLEPSFWSIRLGSLLGFLVLVYFTYQLTKSMTEMWKRWAFILPLFTAPFFIEFFHLARGYGLAMAWLLGSLYFARVAVQSPKSKPLLGFIICTWLTSLSNFSVTPSILILIGLVGLSLWFYAKNPLRAIILSATAWLLQLPFVIYIFMLKNNGNLYYGGSNFIEVTVKPLAKYFFLTPKLWPLFLMFYGVVISFFWAQVLRQPRKDWFQPQNFFGITLSLAALSMFAQQWVLGVNYPADRAALFFFPLLVGTLVHLNFKGVKYLALALAFWFPIDLISSANFTYIRLWPHERVSYQNWKAAANLMGEYPPSLSTEATRQSVWTFYSLIHKKPIYANYIDFPSKWADLVWVSPQDTEQLDLEYYKTWSFEPINGYRLLGRDPPWNETPILDSVLQFHKPLSLYFTFLEYPLQKHSGQGLALYHLIEAQTSQDVFQSYLVAAVIDEQGKMLLETKHNLGVLNENWRKKGVERLKMFIPKLPKSSSKLVLYIHNPYKEDVELKKVRIRICELSDK